MQVKITVDGKPIYLVNDQYAVALATMEPRKDKDGNVEDALTMFKWYADIAQAMKALLQMKVGASNAKTLKELHKAIIQARKELQHEWGTAA